MSEKLEYNKMTVAHTMMVDYHYGYVDKLPESWSTWTRRMKHRWLEDNGLLIDTEYREIYSIDDWLWEADENVLKGNDDLSGQTSGADSQV